MVSGSSDNSDDLSSDSSVSSDDSFGKVDDVDKLDDSFYGGDADRIGEPEFDIDLLSDASCDSDKGLHIHDLYDEDYRPIKAHRQDMELPTSCLHDGAFVEERSSVQWLRDLTLHALLCQGLNRCAQGRISLSVV